jgi:hypothetical protein
MTKALKITQAEVEKAIGPQASPMTSSGAECGNWTGHAARTFPAAGGPKPPNPVTGPGIAKHVALPLRSTEATREEALRYAEHNPPVWGQPVPDLWLAERARPLPTVEAR